MIKKEIMNFYELVRDVIIQENFIDLCLIFFFFSFILKLRIFNFSNM